MISKIDKSNLVKKISEMGIDSISPMLKTYKSSVLTINEQMKSRNLFLYFPKKERIESAKKEIVSLYKVMQKLINYIVFKNPELLKRIGKSGIDFEALQNKSPESLLGYARVDTIFSNGKFRVVEFNSRRPQMYEDADFYSEMLSEIADQQNIVKEDNGYHLMKSIETQFQQNIKRDKPEGIVVLNNFPNQDYPFSSIQRIKKNFPNSEVIVFTCKNIEDFYSKCKFQNNIFSYDNKKIDLLILQSVCGKNSLYQSNGAIKNKSILEAYHANVLEIYTAPSGQISGTKLSLDLLKDKKIQDILQLTEEEKASIELIPDSLHSDSITDISHLDKDKYVIKLTGLGQGQGVIMGESISQKEWVELFEKYKGDGKEFLIQEKLVLEEEEIFDMQEMRFRKAFITLEPFVINDLSNSDDPYISGFAMRAIPVEKYYAGLKFNPAYNKEEIYFGAVIE